ncbi:hypothetical protein [Shinella sp. M27]|uniref:hypothetical protein n=1 Tax=Shinella sp. M27 TaxID=3368614 RepID=UPI003BA10465
MATLLELAENDQLVKIEVELDGAEQAWRTLYGTPEFVAWLNDTLPALETTIPGGDIEPDEQVDACFHEYVIGSDMDPDLRFKKLHRTPDLHIWEFKTLDVRIFGWVPEKDVFICCYGDTKDEIELKNAYGAYMARTHFIRTQLDLDEPKSIESYNYDDVLSDAN